MYLKQIFTNVQYCSGESRHGIVTLSILVSFCSHVVYGWCRRNPFRGVVVGTCMTLSSVLCAIGRCETRYAPDDRVACFDVTARRTDSGVSVSGTVQSTRLRERVMSTVKHSETGIDSIDIAVIEAHARETTVSRGIVPVRKDPEPDAERITEILYGAAVTAFDTDRGWTRVRAPDGYLGWIRTDHLAAPVDRAFEHILSTDISGPADGPETVYAGTECHARRDGTGVTITFRTGTETRLQADALSNGFSDFDPDFNSESVVSNAKRYLGTSYRWGGMTTEGIDCSGLIWMAYRLAGLILPRDADQQRQVGSAVRRENLRPGDLLFFPGHVALSLGDTDYIHADGNTNTVVISTLDSTGNENQTDERHDDRAFELAKRVLHSNE